VFFANLTQNSHHPDTSVEVDQLSFEAPKSHLFESQDQHTQSPISEPETHTSVVAPTQDQADEQPFEEAVPLEDELASLLDDIED